MNQKLHAIAQRNSINDYPSGDLGVTWFGAAFNHSMTLYFALAGLGITGWAVYAMSWIGS
ncbi:hypothetical protein TUM17377_11810 [Shewanella chilikensis]|nr:hypothetical protein TUM17377_11810 [Shewanella chilikensis]